MAQTFKMRTPILGAQAASEPSSTVMHPLGSRASFQDANDGAIEAIYLKGKANTVVGSWVVFDQDDHATTLADADDVPTGPIAVALSVCNNNSLYGWYAIYGKVEAQMAASFADDGLIYLTATAGVCDDVAVTNCRVKNAQGAETIVGAGLAEVRLYYPYVDGTNAD